jgi:hypothetical protein
MAAHFLLQSSQDLITVIFFVLLGYLWLMFDRSYAAIL